MKTRTFLAGATALAFAAGTVALPSGADAAQTFHGGGGHGGGGHGVGGHGGGYRVSVFTTAASIGAVVTAEVVTAAATTAATTGPSADPCRWFSDSAARTATETGSLLRLDAESWTRRFWASARVPAPGLILLPDIAVFRCRADAATDV